MRLILSLLLLCSMSFAGELGYRDATVTTIPALYTDAGSELVFPSGSIRANRVCCENRTGSVVWASFNANGASAAIDGWKYADGSGVCLDDQAMANKIFLRGDGGTVTAGYFQCRVWLRN